MGMRARVISSLALAAVAGVPAAAVVDDVEMLRARPDIDPARIGILGFSVGGSVAIQAAADPRLDGKLVSRQRLRQLHRHHRSRASHLDAQPRLRWRGRAWEPNPLARWVIARQMVDTLPDANDRDVLDRLYLQGDAGARDDVESMTPVGSGGARAAGRPPARRDRASAGDDATRTMARLHGDLAVAACLAG